jgi:hypothetical protein
MYILSHTLMFQVIYIPILVVTVLERLEGLIYLWEKALQQQWTIWHLLYIRINRLVYGCVYQTIETQY